MVSANVVGLNPRIPHKEGILALKYKLEEQTSSVIPSNYLVKLVEFVSQKHFFEFNNEVKQQISGTAIGTKFAPPCACIYTDKTSLKRRCFSHFYVLDILTMYFLFGCMEKQNCKGLWKNLIPFLPKKKDLHL